MYWSLQWQTSEYSFPSNNKYSTSLLLKVLSWPPKYLKLHSTKLLHVEWRDSQQLNTVSKILSFLKKKIFMLQWHWCIHNPCAHIAMKDQSPKMFRKNHNKWSKFTLSAIYLKLNLKPILTPKYLSHIIYLTFHFLDAISISIVGSVGRSVRYYFWNLWDFIDILF